MNVFRNAGKKMEKIDGRRILKILLIILKVILAIPLAAAFILIRCVQYFLKISGTVVSFVCILSSVVVSLAALMEIFLQIQGNGGRRPDLCSCCRRRSGNGSPGGSLQLDMAVLYGKF